MQTSSCIRTFSGKGLPLLPTVRDFGRQLFLALRVLRRAGLIHCDVKPENLLPGMGATSHTLTLCRCKSTSFHLTSVLCFVSLWLCPSY